jgi:hypothetical protein
MDLVSSPRIRLTSPFDLIGIRAPVRGAVQQGVKDPLRKAVSILFLLEASQRAALSFFPDGRKPRRARDHKSLGPRVDFEFPLQPFVGELVQVSDFNPKILILLFQVLKIVAQPVGGFRFELQFIGKMPLQTFDFPFGVEESHHGKSDADQAEESTDAKAPLEMVIQEVHNFSRTPQPNSSCNWIKDKQSSVVRCQ